MIGQQIGPFEVLAKIGEGGMGEVYRARDTKLKREIALKVLPDEFSHDPDRLARFQREAELLATLNHPNIAAIYGLEDSRVSEQPGVKALVLELVEGPTLAELITGARRTLSGLPAPGLPFGRALAIARQIADALEAAHAKGVVHRDLKPGNVKVKDDDTVKVLDFGLAKALVPEFSGAAADAANSPTLTTPGTAIGVILGTAAYMAPEQARGAVVDRRADIWAFGAVVFEMAFGPARLHRHGRGGHAGRCPTSGDRLGSAPLRHAGIRPTSARAVSRTRRQTAPARYWRGTHHARRSQR
jgi:serine/threonine-protein kinase